MFRKVLVANRGEIAIRAFRAAYELGISTVAVFPYEDRNSLHRAKADESYQIGEPGHPVRAYLSVDEVIKAARRAGADAIYPGYGFLSENPGNIEVQIPAAAAGNAVHPYERDCPVRRRHQKVIEIAPAPTLDPALRDRICSDAVAFARHIGYVNAGTVEFLLDERGRHVFIEMNPRIQVEHTVTEQVTDRDLVIAQLRIASGLTLPELRLRQDDVTISGAALHCRVTTEDPSNRFRPDTGV